MRRQALVVLLAVAFSGACKNSSRPAAPASAGSPTVVAASNAGDAASPPASSAPVSLTADSSSPQVDSALPVVVHSDPPVIDVGMSVEDAYAAIPHRRTVWDDADTTVPPAEADYLKTMFQVMDDAVALRVAGQQNYSRGQFDSPDIVGQYDRLIEFTRANAAPSGLSNFQQDVLTALSDQRQIFADWYSQRGQFPYAGQPYTSPNATTASGALHSAYNELMSRYPGESASNKEAFYDYPCAMDFM